MRTAIIHVLLFLCIATVSCERKKHLTGAYINRSSDELPYRPYPALPKPLPTYPWQERFVGTHPRITKEFFRCKGDALNPVHKRERPGREPLFYRDCSGHHGLPLKEGEEFIYPVLLELLNHLQEKTGKRVVITSGHRCPAHNLYCDPRPANWGSKHTIGAEVDFYIEGVAPERIVALIQEFYPEDPFERYHKEGLNVSTPPWFNKELFVKLYLPHEGRSADNAHLHPFIGIQVRAAAYSESQAQNYLRY